MASVKKKTLSRAQYDALIALAGEESAHAVGVVVRELTGVTDLTVKDLRRDEATVFVESESFPVNPCCWKTSAPEWDEVDGLFQGIAGADSLTTSGPGPGTAGPAPQGGTE